MAKRTYASIYTLEGGELTTGLQVSSRCDEALQAARRAAADRGEAVELLDDDGDWIVQPDGSCERARQANDRGEDLVVLETMPDWLRASHRAAGNWGVWPVNGAQRSVVTRAEAEEEVEADEDGYARIVRTATPEEAAEAK